MKKSYYTLKIDAPCKQNWNSMAVNDVGKYCSKCSKTVVDLSKLNNQEIIHFLRDSKGKPCVRLAKNQSEIQIENNSRVQPKFYKILAGILLLGSSNYTSAHKSPQINTEIKTHPVNKVMLSAQNDLLKSDSVKHVINGKVLDVNTHEPIPFVSILIKGTKIKVETNFDGEFSLEIPDSLLKQEVTLVVTAIDHESLEYSLYINQLPLTETFYLHPIEMFLIGEVEMKTEPVEKRK
jgi:hypothetical protein